MGKDDWDSGRLKDAGAGSEWGEEEDRDGRASRWANGEEIEVAMLAVGGRPLCRVSAGSISSARDALCLSRPG